MTSTTSKSWTPESLLGLMHQYQPACVLGAAGELELFDAFRGRSFSAAEAAGALASDERAMAVLLDALAGLGLLAKESAQYRAAAGVEDLLTHAGKQSVLAMVQHQMNCLRRWAQLAEVVRSGRPAVRTPSIRGEARDYESFVEAMDNIGRAAAGPLVASLPAGGFHHLLDVGGASGTYTVAFLRANPSARATIVDLPKVIPQARQRIAASGLADRVELVGADFSSDELPAGADLAWVSAIIHSLSRQQTRELFGKIHRALVAGGRIWIREVFMDDSRTRPVAGALFAVNMLTGTEGGRTFTFGETREDLEACGFASFRVLREDEGMMGVVEARK